MYTYSDMAIQYLHGVSMALAAGARPAASSGGLLVLLLLLLITITITVTLTITRTITITVTVTITITIKVRRRVGHPPKQPGMKGRMSMAHRDPLRYGQRSTRSYFKNLLL